MAPKRRIDYDSMEAEWVAGILSPDQIVRAYTERTGVKCSRPALIKEMNKRGVKRDMRARIIAKAEAIVTEREAIVTVAERALVTMTKNQRDKAVFDASALCAADIISGNRRDIRRSRGLCEKLMDRLALVYDNSDELVALGEMMKDPDVNYDKLNDLYRQVISLGGQVDMIKKLVETQARLIDKERAVYGITDKDGDGKQRHSVIDINLVPSNRNKDDDGRSTTMLVEDDE